MRYLFIFFFFLLFGAVKAQDGYVFIKEQHDQIRKNLDDCRILIKDYDNLSINFKKYQQKFDSLNRVFLLYKELHAKSNSEVKRLDILYQNSTYENQKFKNQVEKKKKKILDTEPEMARKDRMVLHWKAKYYRERKYTKGERIIANFVFVSMAGCGVIAVVSAIRNHTL